MISDDLLKGSLSYARYFYVSLILKLFLIMQYNKVEGVVKVTIYCRI